MASKLKDLGAVHEFWNIKKKGVNVWAIKAFEYEEEGLRTPEMKEDPF